MVLSLPAHPIAGADLLERNLSSSFGVVRNVKNWKVIRESQKEAGRGTFFKLREEKDIERKLAASRDHWGKVLMNSPLRNTD